MDFATTETQETLADLARTVLDDRATHDRLAALEASGDPVFDRDLWAALAQAGILGAVVPAANGGAGLTLLDLLLVLDEAGRHVAPVPLVPTLVGGALPLIRFGDADVQTTWLPRIAAGDAVVTAALGGDNAPGGPGPVEAHHDGNGWRLTGECVHVPYAAQADLLLVAAHADGATGVLLVEPGPEVGVTSLDATNRAPLGHVRLDGAPATTLVAPGDGGDDAVTWIGQRAAAAWCAVQAGVCEGALQYLASHTATRRQFGKPIAEFQAVAQRAADAFIDTQMVRLTAWQAVFRLSEGWDATAEVHAAAFWAGDGAMRVVHAAQHLHGGLGVDVGYPLHRHFLWAKQTEHTVGTPTRALVHLGDLLADTSV